MNTIRASMLPAWNDCPRRAAAKQYRRQIEAAGFPLRQLLPSIGAAIGTAVHAAVTGWRRVGRLESDMTVFHEEISAGAEWDETTPNLQIAVAQIMRMATAASALEIHPAEYELPLRASLAEGWDLTGTLDLITANGKIDDLKTGTLVRPYQAQLGAYALLAESNGRTVTDVSTTFVPRVSLKKPQPPAVRHPIDLDTAKRAAWHTAQNIMADVGRFSKSGSPWEFPANPMSLLCSPKYCSAHGTAFCTLGRPSGVINAE